MKVNYSSLELTDRNCPKCGSGLYLERGKLLDMYRCKYCRFEGLENPANKLINKVLDK